MPKTLLGPEYLEKVFFRIGPVAWKCSATAVRKALKGLLKRAARKTNRAMPLDSDVSERDRALATAVCDDPRMRERIRDLKISVQEGVSRFGRLETRHRVLRINKALPDLLWLGYVEDPACEQFVEWTKDIGVSEPDLGDGDYHLTANVVETALSSDNSPPFSVDSVEFARALILFAGLLRPNEDFQLLKTASRLGCTPLRRLLEIGPDTAPTPNWEDAGAIGSKGGARDARAPVPVRPRLEYPEPAGLNCNWNIEVSANIEQMAVSLLAAEGRRHEADRLASEAFIPGIDAVLGASDADYQRALGLLDAARRERLAAVDARGECAKKADELSRRAYAILGFTAPETYRARENADPPALADDLRAADELLQLASHFDPSVPELAEWLTGIVDHPTRPDFERVAALRRLADAKREATHRFSEASTAFLSNSRSSAEVTDWLSDLDPEELGCLVSGITQKPWLVPAAILVRFGLDIGGDAFAPHLRSALTAAADSSSRRALLRFCDPASSALDREPEARRVMAVERLRDIMHFGPLWLITNPSSGLSDTELVGRTTAEVGELIAGHLELLSGGADLRPFLASKRGPKEAMTSFVEFASTPNAMTGNYRRLRERARETLFLPLVRADQIDHKAASELARRLQSEDVSEQIIEDVRSEIGRGDKIEARHRTQLDRYLRDGLQLLEDVLTKISSDRGQREKEFRRKLAVLAGRLRKGGEIGSLSWFEGEVAEMLSGRTLPPQHPTLAGETGPLVGRAWKTEDTLWAQSLLDLPEFYIEDGIETLEVAAAALRWRAEGRVPHTRDVVDELASRRRFGAALSAIEDADIAREMKDELRRLVEEQAHPATDVIHARLVALRERFGDILLNQSSILPAVKAALAGLDPDEASDQCDLLELELSEVAGGLASEPNDPVSQKRRETLVRLLLLAGAAGVDECSPLEDLEARWTGELYRRESERLHLTMIEGAFRAVETSLPMLSEDVFRFKNRNLRADRWLPSSLSADFAEFLEEPAAKLNTWVASSAAFEREARAALVDLSTWFMRFVGEQTETLHSLGPGDSINPVFDRVIDVSDCVLRSTEPASCIRLLAEVDEVVPVAAPPECNGVDAGKTRTLVDRREVSKRPLDFASASGLTDALGRDDWHAVSEICRELRTTATDEDIRRLDEVADFALTISAIRRGVPSEASDAFVTAARLLGSVGQPVHRTYPLKRLAEFGFDLLAASLALDQGTEPSRTLRPAADGSWAPLLGRRTDFFRRLAAGSLSTRTTRVIDQLCAGALGGEIVERIWDAATNMSEPGAMRAALLEFLHEQKLSEHIIRLASRYESGIRPKLEQLLELRNVAAGRPDLIPVAQSVAEQVAEAAKAGPFRTFVRSLPLAAQAIESSLNVEVEQGLLLRVEKSKLADLEVPISVEPRGLVPEKLEVALFPEDDVTFRDGSRRQVLSDQAVYIPSDYMLTIRFGDSWTKQVAQAGNESLRLRVSAKTLTGDLVNQDAVCPLIRRDRSALGTRTIDIDTLLEVYPGVGNTPAEGEAFIGRIDEIERLHEILVSARRPSPVLLTGMRRIGKTSLLFAFHNRCRQPGQADAVTVYLSLAERRAAFMDPNQDVGSVLFNAIAHALAKRNFSAADHNREVGERLQTRVGPQRMAVRTAIQECRDPESLADSLTLLGERLLEWLGCASQRVVFLIDEAEALVLPYHARGAKRLELEQLLQSLREVSQTSQSVGILLSGSNHINEFAREYKNAFFGSSVRIALAGIDDVKFARRIVAPNRLTPYIQFDDSAIQYAIRLCAGMPQFMWQVGAATAYLVRSGPATRADVRRAVTALVGDTSAELPFKPYDVLEPLEYMLALQGAREQDLLWLLLWRIADASSLVAEQAPQHFVLDQTLLGLDDRDCWEKRLLSLVELDILEMPKRSTYQFKIPIFAEGFRAPRNQQECLVRQQRAGS
jgi:hypothetical protein